MKLGYVRLFDAARLIVAESFSMFREACLEVMLSREAGWVSIREKLASGELDMARAPRPLPVAMQLGLGKEGLMSQRWCCREVALKSKTSEKFE